MNGNRDGFKQTWETGKCKMKFSHSLQFNAVPEWSSKYIAYSHLKKLIYSLQKEKLYANAGNFINNSDTEQTPLLNEANSDPYIKSFIQALDIELKKIDKFFISQETGVIANYDELKDDVKEFKLNLINNRLPSLSDAVPRRRHSRLKKDKFRNTKNKNLPLLNHVNSLPTDTNNNNSSSTNVIVNDSIGVSTNINRHGNELYDDEDDEDDDDDESINSGIAMSIESAPAITNNDDLDLIDNIDVNNNNIIATKKSKNSLNTWGSIALSRDHQQNYLITPFLQHKVTLKKRLVAMFTQLSELKEFIELNQTGFSKICKKFDKSLNTKIKPIYLDSIIVNSHVFKPETVTRIKNVLNETIITYAKLSKETNSADLWNDDDNNSDNIEGNNTEGNNESLIDYDAAEKELSTHLRDHVVWERNTVWKDLMNLERKSQNVKTTPVNNLRTRKKSLVSPLGRKPSIIEFREFNGDGNFYKVETLSDLTKLSIKDFVTIILNSASLLKLILITLVFLLLLFVYSPFQDLLQKNCFAILIYASLLWATETLPLFVTSLLIPLLIVVLPVLKDQELLKPLTPLQSSQFILSTMWSSVIMLLLGGFTLAAALSKYNIAKVLSTYILSYAGTNPQVILLTNMFVAAFVSMWVSNVAAPVLCYSIIQPLLRTLPRNCDYSKSLILGIALASNIGGMSSPIASPQNIFSFSLMSPPPSWIEWFIISTPVCVISIVLIWILLLLTFKTDSKDVKILQFHPIRDPFTLTQWFVSITSISTILLWCLSNKLTDKFGDMGIISIIPIVLLFGTGLLSSDDFNNFMWTIVILAMGGTTLGKAVSNSGLLSTIAHLIKAKVEGQSLFLIVLLFGFCVLVMATFVSHTVAAMILVPLMSEIGSNLPGDDHSRLLVFITVLLCSCAMGLPTSGLPNVTAISMIDEVGDRYLTVGNFITRGVPASFIAYFLVVTVGYGILRLLDF